VETHHEGRLDAEIYQLAAQPLAQADGQLLGRVTYELMEQSWRPPASNALPDWMQLFARTIHEIPKYVASTTPVYRLSGPGAALPSATHRQSLLPPKLSHPNFFIHVL
jgi:hypothetical protein